MASLQTLLSFKGLSLPLLRLAQQIERKMKEKSCKKKPRTFFPFSLLAQTDSQLN